MTNFERLAGSKEEMAKQLVWQSCGNCSKRAMCKLEKRKTCVSDALEWLDNSSDQ